MATSFTDRGIREYHYQILPGKYPLQKDIQLAGLLDQMGKTGDIIDKIHPTTKDTDDEKYRNLVEQLNENANNKASLAPGSWTKFNKKVLAYFDTGLPIYADPRNSLTSAGFILNTQKRELLFFDGSNTRSICYFGLDVNWATIQNLFPTLFAPSTTVRMGLTSNYTILQPKQYMQLIYTSLKANPDATFERNVGQDFIELFSYLNQYEAMHSLVQKQQNYRDSKEIVKDIIKELDTKIHTYLTTVKTINEDEVQILTAVIEYLSSGDYKPLSKTLSSLDSGWINEASKWFYTTEIDDTLNIISELRTSPFFEEALRIIAQERVLLDQAKERDRVERIRALEASDEIEEIESQPDQLDNEDYIYQSHIEDFALEAEEVNRRWANCRVTKEAMRTTISAMQAKLTKLEESVAEDNITLPNIPLPADFVQEDAAQENKTIIQHIREYIERLEQKTAADTSKKTDYHADCALLQTAINQILHFQYAGGEEAEIHYVLTEAQRAAYNEVGEELTDILNNTQKQPVKAPEVLKSVVSVRAEIHRLIAFHNAIREKLTGYQTDLLRLDQGSFVNDIKEFTKKGGSLDVRQKELEDLLELIQNTPEDEFNVISDEKNTWQKQVCTVVDTLKEYGTLLANELQNVLLFKPQIHTATDEHGEPAPSQPREYISVISKAARRKDPDGSATKDERQAAKFNTIMESITKFADTLVSNEASRLATFYEETVQAPKGQGMWSSRSNRSDSGSEADLVKRSGYRPRMGSGDSDF